MSVTKLAVLFGGITVEHEVSVITAVQLMKHVDQSLYQLTPIYIDKNGQWWTGSALLDIEYYKDQDLRAPTGLEPYQLSLQKGSNAITVAILCFHGEYGEAGNIQGVLEVAGIPYQGPGVIGAAAAFDKIMTRQILEAEHIDQAKYIWFTATDWDKNESEIRTKISALKYPVFIKPAKGGSTVGIEKVHTAENLAAAVDRVRKFDSRIIVEAEITDCLEINVSVLGDETSSKSSVPEQPIKADEFLSYADKYERGGGKKGGMASLNRRIPAPISANLTKRVQNLAQQLFHLFDCSGVVRIDFFVNPSTEQVFVTELNTIPGSMSYYLWEASGVTYPELIDELVAIALKRRQQKDSLTQSFDTNILKKPTL